MPQQPYGQQPHPPQQPYQQQPYPQDPYPQDPPPIDAYAQPGAPAMGSIALTIQGSVLTSNMMVPNARFNGYPVPTRYGLQHIPAPAGPLRIELESQWMRTYGQAAIEVNVQPGQEVPVFYAAPMHQFTTGNIGHVKQPRKGVGFFIGVMVFIVLIVFVPVLFAIL